MLEKNGGRPLTPPELEVHLRSYAQIPPTEEFGAGGPGRLDQLQFLDFLDRATSYPIKSCEQVAWASIERGILRRKHEEGRPGIPRQARLYAETAKRTGERQRSADRRESYYRATLLLGTLSLLPSAEIEPPTTPLAHQAEITSSLLQAAQGAFERSRDKRHLNKDDLLHAEQERDLSGIYAEMAIATLVSELGYVIAPSPSRLNCPLRVPSAPYYKLRRSWDISGWEASNTPASLDIPPNIRIQAKFRESKKRYVPTIKKVALIGDCFNTPGQALRATRRFTSRSGDDDSAAHSALIDRALERLSQRLQNDE